MSAKLTRPPVALVPPSEPDPDPAPVVTTGRPYPRHLSAPLPVAFPGYEDVQIVYILSRTSEEVNRDASGFNGWAALIVDHFAVWPFASPAPRGGDVPSWATCPIDLMRWICQVGYPAALDTALDPKRA